MKIDKQIAYKIAGSDFKLQGASDIWDIISIDDEFKSFIVTNGLQNSEVYWHQIGQDYKVISRTMDLTKPITVQGKEVVPLVELAKIAFTEYVGDWNIKSNNTIKHVSGLVLNYCNGFSLSHHLAIENQSDLFQWLEKHHLCYFLPDEMIHFDDEIYNN